MSLLDDARRLNDPLLVTKSEEYGCPFCEGHSYVRREFIHQSDCPWLALPRLVAALEAAEQAVDEWGHPTKCPFCGPRLQLRHAEVHVSACPWQALVAALRGEAPA